MIDNIAAYKRSFETIEKTKQVIMLYDSAISALYQSKTAIESDNFQDRYNNLERAFLIISGLKNSLDHDAAPELSGVLHDWYSSLEMKVLSINSSNSIVDCESCIKYLRTMREAWISVDQQIENDMRAASNSNNVAAEEVASAAPVAKNFDDSILAAAGYVGGSMNFSA